MLSFKTSFLLIFSLLFVSFLQAEVPNPTIGQSPPLAIQIGDTSSFVFKELQPQNGSADSSENGIVEDSILTPCDILFYKSGKLEYCKIIEMTPTTVSYKMCDYQDGPTIVANKSTVKKIRYATGKEEVIIPNNQTFDTTPAFTKPRRDPVAIWSLIASLSSLFFILGSVAGIVLGIISLSRIRKSNGQLTGRGTAKAGIIIGLAVITLIILSL